jgi:hypothetical protein
VRLCVAPVTVIGIEKQGAVAAGQTENTQVLPEGVMDVFDGTLTLKDAVPSRFPAIVCDVLNGEPAHKYCPVGCDGET